MRHLWHWALACAVFCPLAAGCASLDLGGWLPRGSQARVEPFEGTPEDYARLSREQPQQPVIAPGMGIDAPEPSWWSRMTSAVTAPFRSEPGVAVVETPAAGDPTSLSTPLPKPTPELFLSTGRVHEASGRADLAAEQYRKALDVDPHHQEALLSLAHLYDRQNNLSEAAKLYQRVTQSYPRNALAWNDLGLCCFRQHQHDKALTALGRAVDLQPMRKLYRNNLATLLVAMGRTDDALTHLQAVHPPAVAHYNLGYLLSQANQRDLALRQFRLAVEEDPEFAAARQWIALLSSGAGGGTDGSEADVAHGAAPEPMPPHGSSRRQAAASPPTDSPIELDEATDRWTEGLPEIALPDLPPPHTSHRRGAVPNGAGAAPPRSPPPTRY